MLVREHAADGASLDADVRESAGGNRTDHHSGDHSAGARQGRLGEILAMDSTSLTRTLAVMRRKGWIADRRGTDRRERWLSLNTAGERKLQSAAPIWERVQRQVRRELGDDGWGQLMGLTQRLTVALAKQDRAADRRKRRRS
jgi:DNA-binding MarR family transcriptional regulator